jgi:hypothetical protein
MEITMKIKKAEDIWQQEDLLLEGMVNVNGEQELRNYVASSVRSNMQALGSIITSLKLDVKHLKISRNELKYEITTQMNE